MGRFTRGFSGRGKAARDPRLPPGQYDAGSEWPVLTAEVTPRLSTDTWTFGIDGLVANPTTWTWQEIHALAPSTYNGDIHCVTTWSKLAMTWVGVSVDTLLGLAGPMPTASYVMATSHTGYTTNLPLEDVTNGHAWIAWTDAWEEPGAPSTLPMPDQTMLTAAAQQRINRHAGDAGSGAQELATYFVGQIVGSMNVVRPARQVMLDLVTDYADAAERFVSYLAD